VNKTTKGAAMIVILGIIFICLYKYAISPFLKGRQEAAAKQEEEEMLNQTSDARASFTTRIGGDGYLGYWFMTSPEMKRQFSRRGGGIEFTDDGGMYAERLKKFADGQYDCIILPVNSYVEHGAAHNFPGSIVAAIAESKGADGIVAFGDRFPEGKVKELNDANLEIVYTGQSPSSFLLDLTIVDFDLFALKATSKWQTEVGGSKEVLERARNKQGDVFVMWEPELSTALREVPGLKYIWGSDKFGGYIIDVFVFRREFLRNHEEQAHKFLDAYFQVLDSYSSDRERMLADMKTSTGLTLDVLEGMLPKIDWFTLHENARAQFGMSTSPDIPSREGIVHCINVSTGVLLRTQRIDRDPLSGNPYQIISTRLLDNLLKATPVALGNRGELGRDFPPLTEDGWRSLREVGTMRVEPISFQPGQNVLDEEGQTQIDAIAELLNLNYPDYRIAVRGHTGPGDEEANYQLSQERAQAVAQRLTVVGGTDPDRLHAEGTGSKQPPPRLPGESFRAFQYRLPRVEFVLLEDNAL
jgi:hypothetical protein